MNELPSAYQKAFERADSGSGVPDVYHYGNLPDKVRVQVIHIWEDILHSRVASRVFRESDPVFPRAGRIICKKYGLFHLTNGASTAMEEVCAKLR